MGVVPGLQGGLLRLDVLESEVAVPARGKKAGDCNRDDDGDEEPGAAHAASTASGRTAWCMPKRGPLAMRS